MSRIAFFGNSTLSVEHKNYKMAQNLGKLLADNGFDIITGGYHGIMEAAQKGASDYNVKRIGVLLESNPERNANEYVNEKIIVDNYIARLTKMLDMSDAYVVFPGGTGTLLELAAVWALKERKYHSKPIVIIGEQWQEVIEVISFYSEKSLDSFPLVYKAGNEQEAYEHIVNNI